jgi:hypothetical protein
MLHTVLTDCIEWLDSLVGQPVVNYYELVGGKVMCPSGLDFLRADSGAITRSARHRLFIAQL